MDPLATMLSTTVRQDIDADVTVIRANGHLSLQTAPVMRSALQKCMAEYPSAVVVDVSGCVADAPAALAIFPAVLNHQDANPFVAILLGGADDDFLRDGGEAAMGDVPTYLSCAEALLAAAAVKAKQRRFRFHAAHSPAAPGVIRDAIGDVCDQWGLESMRNSALLITSELVTNVIRHARSDVVVDAILRDNYLHLRVHDRSAQPPQLDEKANAEQVSDSGRGLPIVAYHSTAWGYVLKPDGRGKVVWATLRVRPVGAVQAV
jgi:anti-sigma regulatory factor (Ser/Thr protein kinase)